jgi:hypothetical protein
LGPSPKDPDILVEIMIQERPLRTAMLDYSQRILILSLVISLFTAALVYLSLHLLMVRPMRRITASMTAFRDDPENSSRVLPSSDRTDEIGVAQRELVNMQEGLRAALLQKNRLAALGTAVTKINHDLKNILATAILVSDRLAKSDDPQVRSGRRPRPRRQALRPHAEFHPRGPAGPGCQPLRFASIGRRGGRRAAHAGGKQDGMGYPRGGGIRARSRPRATVPRAA